MSPERFRAILMGLGLYQHEAADLFGYSERSIRRFETGEMPVPRAVALALELSVHCSVDASTLQNMVFRPAKADPGEG